jgi:hypothetical protein
MSRRLYIALTCAAVFFYLFFLSSTPALSQTHIEGVLNGNVKWTENESPYILSGKVFVEKGALLTIERNVAVIFTRQAQFIIRGRIEAYRFFLNGHHDAYNDEHLTFSSGSSGNITKCAFLDINIDIDSSNISLTSSVVSNRNGTGITVGKDAFPYLADNVFHDNSYFAVYRKGKKPLNVLHCFWGSNTGPSGSGKGKGDAVNLYVQYQPFKEKEDKNFLILSSNNINAKKASSGEIIELKYMICNLNTFNHKVILGASLFGADKKAYNHPASDIRTIISPGFHEYTRNFVIPFSTPNGIYDVYWGVMKNNLSAYFSLFKQRKVLVVENVRSS